MLTLYLDLLNFVEIFWDAKASRRDPWRELLACECRVKKFVSALTRSKMHIVAVVDADQKTDQARKTWRIRRQKELKTENRRVVLGVDVLLTEMFRAAGVRVVRPVGADADDVLAALAASADEAAPAALVSRDNDFFWYDRELPVYSGWVSSRGLVELTPAAGPAPGSRPRPRRTVQPELALAVAEWSIDGVVTKFCANPRWDNTLTRGVSSSSDKAIGSLHLLSRPVRAAVYARLGATAVAEVLPLWEGGEVVWSREEVAADASLDALLDGPTALHAWLEGRDHANGSSRLRDWRLKERDFNRCVLVAEIVSAASGGTTTMCAVMRQFPQYIALSRRW